MAVDLTLTQNCVNIYTIRSSINNFDIKSLFFGKRTLLKPLLRSFDKIINNEAKPILTVVTNRKVDKDANQLFFKMERLRLGDLSINKFAGKSVKDEIKFINKLERMLKDYKKKYHVEIDKGDFLRSIYRPIVVDEDEGTRTIKNRLRDLGKIQNNKIDSKMAQLLSSVAKGRICTLEWVDSLLESNFRENITPVTRQAIPPPTLSIDSIKKMSFQDEIVKITEFDKAIEILNQLEQHLTFGDKCLSTSKRNNIIEIIKRGKKKLEGVYISSDNIEGTFTTIKKDIKRILKKMGD